MTATTATKNTVLVTGGTGFVASHCILQLLQQGYPVKTTSAPYREKTMCWP